MAPKDPEVDSLKAELLNIIKKCQVSLVLVYFQLKGHLGEFKKVILKKTKINWQEWAIMNIISCNLSTSKTILSCINSPK